MGMDLLKKCSLMVVRDEMRAFKLTKIKINVKLNLLLSCYLFIGCFSSKVEVASEPFLDCSHPFGSMDMQASND